MELKSQIHQNWDVLKGIQWGVEGLFFFLYFFPFNPLVFAAHSAMGMVKEEAKDKAKLGNKFPP